MIDIIIPCYNAHETLDRCLGSILCQRILPSIYVTLVNDAGKDYSEFIQRYSPIMNIQEIGYKENGGAAKARNYGIENTNKPFIMFLDSDDALANPFSVVTLLNEMQQKSTNVIVIGTFIEEMAPLIFKKHENDVSFMHGKLYKRAFLDKYNIRQNEKTRYNEDVGFNLLARMISKTIGYTTPSIDFVASYWLQNPNSVVRHDKKNFDHGVSYQGFADNLTYVYEELQKRNIDSDQILAEKVTTMERLYLLYHQKTDGYPQFKKDNLKCLKNYYNVVYRQIEDKVTDELFDEVYEALPFTNKSPYTKKDLKRFLIKIKGENK